MHVRVRRANWFGLVLLPGLGLAAAARPPASAPGTQPSTAPATAPVTQPALDPRLGAILDRLEKRDVSDLRAGVSWRQQYVKDLPEDWLTKRGTIWYQKGAPVARFLIHFTEQIRGDSERRTLDERHMFDGRWYIEIQSRTKSCTWREVRRPDDPGDPYKIGEGLFPLPFGQKKQDILREFAVRLLPAEPNDPEDTDHLRLAPQPGSRTGENYRELDFWVVRGGRLAGLPIRVRVAKVDGTGRLDSHITINFNEAELNTGFSRSVFELECPPGYTRTEERLDDPPPKD